MEELERQVQQLRVVTPNETCGANTALARPILDVECGCCGSNFFVEASVLYWCPRVSGTEFASGPIVINTELTPDDRERNVGSLKGCLQSIDFCWNWGFKVGAGYNLPCDRWDIFLNYTAFNSKGRKSVCTRKDNEYIVVYKLFPIVETGDNTPSTSIASKQARSKFCIDLDALEFDLGRSFYISKSVVLYPRIGLKVFWIQLNQNTQYSSGQIVQNILKDEDKPDFDYAVKDANKFLGVGSHFAFGKQWPFL